MPYVIFTALQSIGQNSLRAIEKSGFPVDTFESSNMESTRLFVIFSRSLSSVVTGVNCLSTGGGSDGH